MNIPPVGTEGSTTGSPDHLTGAMRVDTPFQGGAAARVGGAAVTFEPGARTARHAHPPGQALIVTAGRGCGQREGGPVEVIRPGDVVWFAPDEEHWPGAASTTAMTHVAVAERPQDSALDWMEQKSQELCPAGTAGD